MDGKGLTKLQMGKIRQKVKREQLEWHDKTRNGLTQQLGTTLVVARGVGLLLVEVQGQFVTVQSRTTG